MDPRLQRTQFAAQAASLADQFALALQGNPVSGYRVEMTAPENSTGGGVQALQHIRLVPPQPGARAIVVGNANRSTRSAELRTLDYVNEVSLDRFGERTRLDPRQYDAFVAVAQHFLENFGLTVTHATKGQSLRPPAAPPRSPARGGGGFSPLAVVMIVLWSVIVLAVGVGVGLMARSGKL